MRARAQRKGGGGSDDADQLAATASAARGPELRSWRSLGAPCSTRRPLPPSTSIIERKFLTTRADGAAVAVWCPADASCACCDVPSASFSCDVEGFVSESGM